MSIAMAKAVSAWPGRAWTTRLVGVGARLIAATAEMRRAAVGRRELLALSERELRDIGISRVDAIREAERPLWRRQA